MCFGVNHSAEQAAKELCPLALFSQVGTLKGTECHRYRPNIQSGAGKEAGKEAKDVKANTAPETIAAAVDPSKLPAASNPCNIDTSALSLSSVYTLPLPFTADCSCMDHRGSSLAFALHNGCMLVISTQTLGMIALSPVMTHKVKTMVFREDDGAVYFVTGDGVFGVWHYKEFHQRVYGSVSLVLYVSLSYSGTLQHEQCEESC
jgi:hypothetical protein